MSWYPLGHGDKSLINEPVFTKIGQKYGKTAAQVVLRWNVQRGVSVLPKSVHVDRMEQNFDIWDFTLTDDDMAVISAKDKEHSEIVDHSSAEFVKFINGLKV